MNNKGVTLTELMIVVAILGILFMVGPRLMKNTFIIWKVTEKRTEVQRDARVSLNLIEGLLRRASASSITLTRQDPGQPPYSKILFSVKKGNYDHDYQIYQFGDELWFFHQDPDGIIFHSRVFAENLRYVSFAYPQSNLDNLLSVALCFERGTYAANTKRYYLSTQKIEVMNL